MAGPVAGPVAAPGAAGTPRSSRSRMAQCGEGRVSGVAGAVDGDALVGDEPPVAQDGHPVGEPYGLVDVMGDQEHGRAVLAAQLVDQVVHLQPGQRVQGGERLVQQQQFGLPHQGPGEGDPLGLAAGERGGPGLGVPFQTHFGERPQPVRRTGSGQGDGHVGEDLLGRYEAGFLEDDRAALGHQHLSPVGPVQRPEDAQQRRLAAAAGSEKGDELPRAMSSSRPSSTARLPKTRRSPRTRTAVDCFPAPVIGGLLAGCATASGRVPGGGRGCRR